MGVQIPTTWQGVATQAQISPAQQLATAGVAGAAIPQAAGVVAYPIQQFQVSPQVGYSSQNHKPSQEEQEQSERQYESF